MKLTNRAVFGVVLAAAMLSGGNVRSGRLADRDDGYSLDVVIVVFDPLVQSLAKQRNYAVAEESRSDCETTEHRTREREESWNWNVCEATTNQLRSQALLQSNCK